MPTPKKLKTTKRNPDWWTGRMARVTRCLVDKPRHSGNTDTGCWLLDASKHDPARREPCHAVGQVTSWHEGDIVAVEFVVPSLLLEGETLTTVLFAHVEDLKPTRAKAMSWPLVEGADVI